MNNKLTYEKLLNLPNIIEEQAKKYGDFSELLTKEVCDKYNIREVRLEIERKFTKYKTMRSISRLPVESLIDVTPSYEKREGCTQRKISKPTEDLAITLVEGEDYLQKFYNSMVVLSTKITLDEAHYLVKKFFCNKSHKVSADEMYMGKTKLEEIKRSCIVKTYCELEAVDDE